MYSYQALRPITLMPEGQSSLIGLALRARSLGQNGLSMTLGTLMDLVPDVYSNWDQMAFVDRLIELGFLREVNLGEAVATQYRRFRWVEKF